MKTLIIVIIILLCVLTTPLSLKRVIDRNKDKYSKSWPGPSNAASGTDSGSAGVDIAGSGARPDTADPSAGTGCTDAGGNPGAAESAAGYPPAGSASGAAHGVPASSGSADFDLQSYLIASIDRILKDSIRITSGDPAEARFLMSFATAAARAAARRRQAEAAGEHLPPFLIASITENCNLHCTGCYAHAREAWTGSNDPCSAGANNAADNASATAIQAPLSAADWDRIFTEAEDLGISFIFLVGGEPLLRRDVIETASRHRNILFPIITNGILIDDAYLQLFDSHRNLLPMLSIEGELSSTDARRGPGTYALLQQKMQNLASFCIPFGVSITVTTQNLREVTSTSFAEDLGAGGCRLILFIDYVATSDDDLHLEPGEADRALMALRLKNLRAAREDMLFLSFPGDEKSFGGCLAAGRGFFHIAASGAAEPCPFAPYSDMNLQQVTLREALQSGLFTKLTAADMLQQDHTGGCALAHKGGELRAMMGDDQPVR